MPTEPPKPAAPALTVEVPSVPGPLEGAEDFIAGTPMITVTPSEIAFAGSTWPLTNGSVVMTEMPKVVQKLMAEAPTMVYLAIDASIPYLTMHAVVSAAGAARIGSIGMVIKVADAPRTFRVAPFSGPDRPEFAQQVLSVTPTKIVEWNWTDGRTKPKVSYSVQALGKLAKDYAVAHSNLGSIPSEPPLIIEGEKTVRTDLFVQVALAARMLSPYVLVEIQRNAQ